MSIYYQDDSVTLYHGDALNVLETMDSGSVDCIVTSPPYFGLRDYGVDGQIGAETSPAEFVETLRAVFAEARRVLADDGTLWLNLGDSYASNASNNGGYSASSTLDGFTSSATKGRRANEEGLRQRLNPGVPHKNLLGIPWRVAFALQDDGWILRNDIIWHKSNAMPESVTDRLSTRHEHLFMFSKKPRYWFGLDAIREPHEESSLYHQEVARRRPHAAGKSGAQIVPGQSAQSGMAAGRRELNPLGRNPGDVWTIATQPFPGAHFAVMPRALAERAIQAGCKPGGTVLDPFSGSGTTGLAAAKYGHKYVGIDLNHEYLDLSLQTRLQQPGLDLGSVS